MKRLLTLIALLGLVSVFAGCNQDNANKSGADSSATNAAPAAPSTNK